MGRIDRTSTQGMHLFGFPGERCALVVPYEDRLLWVSRMTLTIALPAEPQRALNARTRPTRRAPVGLSHCGGYCLARRCDPIVGPPHKWSQSAVEWRSDGFGGNEKARATQALALLTGPAGLEPASPGFGDRRSLCPADGTGVGWAAAGFDGAVHTGRLAPRFRTRPNGRVRVPSNGDWQSRQAGLR